MIILAMNPQHLIITILKHLITVQYIAAANTVTSTIKDRFDQPDYRVYVNLEEMLLKGANGKKFEDTMTLLEKNYQNEFDFVQLKIQLESLSCSFKDHSSNNVSLGDVVNHLRLLTQGQRFLLDQIMKLAQYFLVMSASNATSEQSFSAMRRIKTYLRNSMTLSKNFEDTMTLLEKNYQNEFDFVQLKIQLESLSCSFKDHSSNNVSLGDVVNHLRLLTQGQRFLLDQIMKLAQYFLVMSASNATSEQSFSAMRRIKTYLRNSMTQNRLNHTMCINLHSEKVDSTDLKLLLNEFIDTNDRRKQILAHV